MQAFRPPASGQGAPGEFIDDDHFAFLDDVIHILVEQVMCPQGGIEVMHQVQVLGVVKAVFGFQQPRFDHQALDIGHAFLGEIDLFLLLIDGEIALADLVFIFTQEFRPLQAGNQLVDPDIKLRGFIRRPGNDQRGAGFIDQDRVNFVDDRKRAIALGFLVGRKRHVIAQVIETQFVIGRVNHVAGIGRPLCRRGHAWDNDAHGKAHGFVNGFHPLGVSSRQVVVDRNHVGAFPGQRVQVHRQGGHQGLAFTGLHFGDFALVQHHPADQLHVIVTQAHGSPRGFTDQGKCFG